MKKDTASFVRRCHACQIHGNLLHQPTQALQDMRTPWPFHTWGLDLIRPIRPASNRYIWIITATEYFTKWVEAVPLRNATGAVIANFIREYLVCRFGIPYKIVSDNGTPFINKQVHSTLVGYGIKDRRSTPYYPQGNGQAKATNKMLIRILSRIVHEYEGGWSTHLPDALCAYRTSSRTATGFSPYSLVYGSEAVSLVELLVPSARVVLINDVEWDADTCAIMRAFDLEAAEELRNEASRCIQLYQGRTTRAFNKRVNPRIFKRGDIILRTAEHVRRQLPGPSKFSPQWEGPFLVSQAHESGYYELQDIDGNSGHGVVNGKWLKLYHC